MVEPPAPAGRVVVINGGSSAGKTTLARRVQSWLGGAWLLVGIDMFLWALPGRMLSDVDGITVADDGSFSCGETFLARYDSWRYAVAALSRSGADVLVDEVLLDAAASQRRWDAALGGLDVCWVGVRCPAEVAAAREAARGDRPAGIAWQQATAVHTGVRYDVEVDGGAPDPDRAARLLVDAIVDRWPSAAATLRPGDPVIPAPLSAWPGPRGVPAPPWES